MSPGTGDTPRQLRTPVLCYTALGPHPGPAHGRGPKTDGSIRPGPPTQNDSARGRLPTVIPSRCIISATDIGSPDSQHCPLPRLSGGLPASIRALCMCGEASDHCERTAGQDRQGDRPPTPPQQGAPTEIQVSQHRVRGPRRHCPIPRLCAQGDPLVLTVMRSVTMHQVHMKLETHRISPQGMRSISVVLVVVALLLSLAETL